MSEDIKARLRDTITWEPCGSQLYCDALAAIEALEAERDALRAEVARLRKYVTAPSPTRGRIRP